MTPTVQFLIDHQSREETINLMMATMLRGIGLNVRMDHQDFFVTPEGYDFFKRTRVPADYTVTPSYSLPRTLNLLARAVREGSELILQHSEQLFADAFVTDKLSGRFPRAYNRHILAHLVWGKHFAEKLKANGLPPEKIWITGNCKIDLARRMYKYERSLRERLTDRQRKILFLSNFTVADLGNEGWQDFKKRYGYRDELNLYEYALGARNSATSWIRDVATKLGDVDFVVRVHPGEMRAPYQELAEIPNISISPGGELIEDLVECDAVAMFTSTAVYEIAALGIPYCNLRVQEPLPEALQDDSYRLFNWVDKRDFMEFSRGTLDEMSQGSGRDSIIAEHMAYFKGNTIVRAAIAIHHIVGSGETSINRFDRTVGRTYQCIPLIKDLIIKGGYWGRRRELYSRIADWADAHWESRIRRGNVIMSERSLRAEEIKTRLLRQDEVDCMRKGEYSSKLTSHGWMIELPDEIDSAR